MEHIREILGQGREELSNKELLDIIFSKPVD